MTGPFILLFYLFSLTDEKLRRGCEILKYGAPERGPDVCYYSNHVLCYDRARKIPLWVCEHLTHDRMKGNYVCYYI